MTYHYEYNMEDEDKAECAYALLFLLRRLNVGVAQVSIDSRRYDLTLSVEYKLRADSK